MKITEIAAAALAWGRSATDAGEHEMAGLALEAADLLLQAAEQYHGSGTHTEAGSFAE